MVFTPVQWHHDMRGYSIEWVDAKKSGSEGVYGALRQVFDGDAFVRPAYILVNVF